MKIKLNSKTMVKVGLLAVITLHLFILNILIFFPYQELFTYPHFTNSGLLPYAQIWDQHFPGLLFFPINFASLGMVNEHIALIWAMGIVGFVHIFLFIIGQKIFSSYKKALLINFFFLIWQPFLEGWVLWIDSFLPLFYLPAFYFCLKTSKSDSLKSYFLAGLFIGFAILFKQVVVPLAVFVGLIFLAKRQIKEVVYYSIGVLIPVLLMLFYMIGIGVWSDFWYWTVTYNLTVFADYGKKSPHASGLIRILGIYGMSIFALLSKKKEELIWVFVFLAASLTSAYARFDFVHFQPSLPFVAIAVSIAWYSLKGKWGMFVKGAYLAGALIILVNFYKGHIGEKVFFFDPETKTIARKIGDYTEEKERIFIYGSIPHLYQMSNTLPAGDVYVQHYSWFFRVSEDEILQTLIEDMPNLIVADFTVHVDGQNLIEYSPKIYEYIVENYKTKEKVGTTQFMFKN